MYVCMDGWMYACINFKTHTCNTMTATKTCFSRVVNTCLMNPNPAPISATTTNNTTPRNLENACIFKSRQLTFKRIRKAENKNIAFLNFSTSNYKSRKDCLAEQSTLPIFGKCMHYSVHLQNVVKHIKCGHSVPISL